MDMLMERNVLILEIAIDGVHPSIKMNAECGISVTLFRHLYNFPYY